MPDLLHGGYRVRVVANDPAQLQGSDWLQRVEIVQGDVLSPASLAVAMSGIDVAYNLIQACWMVEALSAGT